MNPAINIRGRKGTVEHDMVSVCKEDILTHAKQNLNSDTKDVVNFLKGKAVRTKRRNKVIVYIYTTVLATWTNVMIAMPASAETTDPTKLPPEVDEVLLKIQIICLGICVSVAIIMAMVAGFFRMIGLREEAKKRYKDAVAGMTMVLTAPAVLGVIATIVRGFLALFPNYTN